MNIHHQKLALVAVCAGAAMAGTSAHAQDSVTIYGSLDLGVYSKQLAGEARLATLTSGIMNASRWGVRGAEDLGSGLKARFDMSSYIRVDTGESGRSAADGFWARYAWVGLDSASLGQVRLGRISTPNFIQTIRFNPFADSSLSPVFMHAYLPSAAQPMMTSHGTTDSAWSNSVAYHSPSFGGFEVAGQVAASEGTTAGRRAGVSASYLSPTLSVGLSFEDMRHLGLSFAKPPLVQAVEHERAVQLGLAYDFGVVKVFGQLQRTQLENLGLDVKLDTAQLGAAVPVGPGRVLVSAAHTVKEQNALADVKRDTVSVGYDYALSKRTDVYAIAVTDKVTALKRGNGYTVGLRHNF